MVSSWNSKFQQLEYVFVLYIWQMSGSDIYDSARAAEWHFYSVFTKNREYTFSNVFSRYRNAIRNNMEKI